MGKASGITVRFDREAGIRDAKLRDEALRAATSVCCNIASAFATGSGERFGSRSTSTSGYRIVIPREVDAPALSCRPWPSSADSA